MKGKKRKLEKNRVEIVSGYVLRKKDIGCIHHDNCFTCAFTDCIKSECNEDVVARYRAKRKEACQTHS